MYGGNIYVDDEFYVPSLIKLIFQELVTDGQTLYAASQMCLDFSTITLILSRYRDKPMNSKLSLATRMLSC